jgi:hypothetical protein
MAARRLVPALALALAACAPDFPPRSALQDLRVLAIVADHPELGPPESVPPGDPSYDAVSLQAWDWLPPALRGAEVTWSFEFCPFTLGAAAGYACAVSGPACEPVLAQGTHDPAETLAGYAVDAASASPAQLALACLQSLGGTPPPSVPPQLPPVVEVLFRYRVSGGGQSREAVQLVPVRTGARAAPTSLNRNPVIQSVEIGGQAVAPGGTCPSAPPAPPCPALAPGGELEVRAVLDPSSAEGYLDPAGRPAVEAPAVSFYSSAGRFDYDRALGPDARVKLEHEEIASGTTLAEVWVVARDLRGGEAIQGPFLVQIAP